MTEKGKEIVIDLDDEVLVGSNNMDSTEHVISSEDNVVVGDCVNVPEVGIKFNNENELFEFYKRYAYDVGFPVRKRNSKKGEDGLVNYVTLTCSREGRRSNKTSSSLKPQPTIQTGCKARLTAASDAHGIWRICTIFHEHNHGVSPSKSRLYRCNRKLSAHVKRQLEVNDMAGIPLHKSYNATVVEAGGYENMTFVEKDCRNYVEKVRRLKFGKGDAAAIQAYFSQMQAQCSGFYFSMDLDNDSHLRNLFWADNRCREAYKEFGDVVTFDTTYLTNKYDMPFAPFVGVNHHGQSTLLGCGLLSNEDTDTFVWLFKTWLLCMRGRAPNGIITDQDRAMQNAIQIVFPTTKHRWCLWHIMKKLPEKFGYHENKASIFGCIHILVYDSQFVSEFEEGWRMMLDTYSLYNNDWLSGLYENRGRWVSCYLKTTFWAGMSTTQRSESMNAFFDGYVHSKTSLKQFVEQYERALRKKVEKEFQADFKSFSQMVPCATKYEMERQFQSVYTIAKFREFQEEITGKVYCDVISTTNFPNGTNYEVTEDVIHEEWVTRKKYSLTYDAMNCGITCSCHLFEFRGILCRHAISVLMRNHITSVPDTYILRRWRRDVSRAHTRVAVHYAGLVSTPGQLRYDRMCEAFFSLADIARNDEERTDEIIEWIGMQSKLIMSPKWNSGSNLLIRQTMHLGSQSRTSNDTGSGSVQDPKCTKRKGAPKKLCRKSTLESISTKRKANSNTSKGKGMKVQKSNLGNDVPVVQTQVPMSTHTSVPELVLGTQESHAITQSFTPYINVGPRSSTHVCINFQGNAIPYFYPHVAYDVGTNLGCDEGSNNPATDDDVHI